MSIPDYRWRRLAPAERAELLAARKASGHPWHSPPHRTSQGARRFHITAACFEHLLQIGLRPGRMEEFTGGLLEVLAVRANQIFAWCVLPNHYHALVESPDILALLRELGRFHGRTSRFWNREDAVPGRKVFFRAVEKVMRTDRHFRATLNYVHHNPVHHGYVEHWQDWPWSSAADYLARTGTDEARRIWHEYPIKEYGKGWDNPQM